MLRSSVTTKGQVTIPIEMREKYGIKPGDLVGFVDAGDAIVITRQEAAIDSIFGSVKVKKAATLKQIDAAIVAGWNRNARS